MKKFFSKFLIYYLLLLTLTSNICPQLPDRNEHIEYIEPHSDIPIDSKKPR